jgi:prepilin-type N-terminal cleavage/methylation domain-containing protein
VTRPTDRARRDAGFTLIEVLIAMVILSVGLLALEGMAVGAARTVAASSRRSVYAEAATDAMERTLGSLREGQAVAGGSSYLRDPSGANAATLIITAAGSGTLAAPSPPIQRWDVKVRVIPLNSARLADSVSLVASVIQ